MDEKTMLLLIVVVRAFAACGAIYAAYLLMQAGKDGWGWLIFVAVVLGSGNVSYKPD